MPGPETDRGDPHERDVMVLQYPDGSSDPEDLLSLASLAAAPITTASPTQYEPTVRSTLYRSSETQRSLSDLSDAEYESLEIHEGGGYGRSGRQEETDSLTGAGRDTRGTRGTREAAAPVDRRPPAGDAPTDIMSVLSQLGTGL
ncbi:hypothetical protein KIPB_012696 [Kipferlia bialata]|uniref:Uncharacterized protein n=1 Tax=Kipferlia bialata TaxID=797122 RepID=A0A9K3D7X6_9EUKA|nr:hypothetical protein KIPB_012696 [Kipferlia bialata]|eukprot:g12696.t1